MTMTAPDDENRALERGYQFMRSLIKNSSLEWVVIRTNPDCEDRAFEGINATGVTVFQPMMTECRKHRQTKNRVVVSRSMFPRYLFVGLNAYAGQNCDLVRKCDGVEKILSATFEGAPHRVPVREMLRIVETSCEAEVGGKLVKGQLFSIGDEVMLVAGTGAKLNGVVRDLKKNGRAVRVEVEAFGRATKATVPIDKVALR
ncbi:Transcription antitermination protein RfaH [Pseudovibrio sp. Ad46]|uniref:transcription termination/antitermination NusG family protein n=1 Tax=Pseudovibrio sp. Ad46 TaxID=989432 RepID=UPI0007AEC49E|nr:transcription termination/antitermination NusG family protein [Pseudovibrio sp. Ad46]KZK80075.1 Transcription antitermination protein RfaH [Pseudovibrio sp. Ad46]